MLGSTSISSRVRAASARQSHPSMVNVGETERMASLAAGGGLALYGLTRGTIGGLGIAALGGALVYRGITGHCACYNAFGITSTAPRGERTSVAAQHGVKIEESVTILRAREDLYRYWHEFTNLPHIMRHLESVRHNGDGTWHWVACGPMGYKAEWNAEVITERENELISWRSVGESEVDTAGSVHFTPAPGDRGTEVKVVLKYDPPGGRLGIALARLLGESPSTQIRDDLRRFKQIMETGTVAMSTPSRFRKV